MHCMDKESLDARVDDFLFGRGVQLKDYFIEQTPVSEVLGYRSPEGREFDLSINDPELAAAVFRRLKDMGVRIIKLT